MPGILYKRIESELNNMATNYMRSTDAAQRDMGHAISDVVKSMKGSLERNNPWFAEKLRNINSGWAMYARMRGAAANRVTSEGVFTPGDLLSAIKRGDRSVGKGAFARGDALMQDFATAAQHVLPSRIPTSGTSERAAMMAAPVIGEALLHRPSIALGAAGLVLPYLSPVMRGINAAARPTTGFRRNYAEAGRGLGTLRPFMVTPLSVLGMQ
jgi:hypothetical protein